MSRVQAFAKVISAATAALVLLAPFDGVRANNFSVVYTFAGQRDGGYPVAGLIRDASGNLYGTTSGAGFRDCGVVFKIAPNGFEIPLVVFTSGSNGAAPHAALIKDKTGNFYGTTTIGGQGHGVVFEIVFHGGERVLYTFSGGKDGANPYSGLIRNAAGDLYGTTYRGGAQRAGVVFKVAPDGIETVLHAFTGGTDGGHPYAGLIRDRAGTLYGTTIHGGTRDMGVVFKVAPDGTETVLHSFTGSDGANPYASLIGDTAGNLYGTTTKGGAGNRGVIFRLAPDGTETVLHAFHSQGGILPWASLIIDKSGNLYGTAFKGGANKYGTVFRLKK